MNGIEQNQENFLLFAMISVSSYGFCFGNNFWFYVDEFLSTPLIVNR